MPPPLPRCSSRVSSSLISPRRISLPRKGHRVGLHIVLFEACSAFTRVAACTLARSPICDPLSEGFRHFVSSMPAPVASGWSESPGGACTHWKAPPYHGAPPFPSLRGPAGPFPMGRERDEGTSLLIEPHVLKPPAVENAVDDQVEALDARPPAGRGAGVEDDRPRGVAREPPLDLPHQLPPLFGIGLARLPVDQRVDLLVAITGVVAVRTARVVLVEHLVGVVDRCLAYIDADRIVLADDLWEPVGGLDRLKGAVDVDLLHLVDRDDGRVAVPGGVAGRDGDPEPLVRAVAELFHDRARLGAVLRDVGIVARQFGELLGGQTPDAVRRRLHHPADQALPLDQD